MLLEYLTKTGLGSHESKDGEQILDFVPDRWSFLTRFEIKNNLNPRFMFSHKKPLKENFGYIVLSKVVLHSLEKIMTLKKTFLFV